MTPTQTDVTFEVREGQLDEHRFVESVPPAERDLAPDELLVRVEKFGFSANNVTYAVIGRSFRYFEFFPASEPGWGRVPVWGMGEVVASRHAGLARGTRLYGYLPLGRYVRLPVARTTPAGFDVDRGDLPAVYNQYNVVGQDPFHLAAQEDQMMLFRPLFFTSLLLDDYLAEHGYFGAETVLVSSASAKTSFGLAYMHSRRDGGARMLGLTSERNVRFVERLGLYDGVVTYEKLGTLAREAPVVFVDVAGSADTLGRVQAHFGAALKASILVGMSHWDQSSAAGVVTEAQPHTQMFFAPSWVEKRLRDWGTERLVETVSSGWREFMAGADERCRLVRGRGRDAVAATWTAMLRGQPSPEEGAVLTLWEA